MKGIVVTTAPVACFAYKYVYRGLSLDRKLSAKMCKSVKIIITIKYDLKNCQKRQKSRSVSRQEFDTRKENDFICSQK